MQNKRTSNPILIIIITALVLVAITVLIIFLIGGRFTTLDNGAKFLGEYDNGQPISGTIKYQNGLEAELDKINNTLTYSNGDVYKGEIVDGLRHGRGVMTFTATGDVYEGTFENDEISGSGKFTYANGDIYEGEVLKGKKHGKGKFSSANGNVYDGYYSNDVRSGKGKFVWASGAWYEGDYLNDLKHGFGVMVFENGDRYEGYFAEDMRHGHGTYSWVCGDRYNGTFRNNLMDTRATDDNGNFIKNSNGDYVHAGIAKYTFNTYREYSGYFVEGIAVAVNTEENFGI